MSRHRWSTVAGVLAVGGAIGVALVAAVQGQSPAGGRGPSAAGIWAVASPGRPIVLPADHASHPAYKLEWWYYTGNLDAADGRRFGYQVTFFRVGVDPAPANPSRWAVRDLFMTHVAVTDVANGRLLFSERLNRAGPGWAGADPATYRVWNEDWTAGLDPPGAAAGAVAGPRAHRLHAAAQSLDTPARPFGVDLRLAETGPPVLHGEAGYSRKGTDPGNASHYYSLPRMATTGTLSIDGRDVPVSGLSWMDHEFGTSFLEAGQIGWNWFAVQLADGRSLMIYRFRRADGSPDPRSSGSLVEADGRVTPVPADGFTLEPGRTWTSPDSRARYPVSWTVRLPRQDLTLTVDALVDDQELRTSVSSGVTYWEGAVDVKGTGAGRPIAGRGYLEMTGYTGLAMGTVLR